MGERNINHLFSTVKILVTDLERTVTVHPIVR